ncbi:MAG: hypothetical protein ACREGE_03910 [Candidatus Microsaccharimonas sp.]
MSDILYQPRLPQDDFDGDDEEIDPILLEESEDITKTLHVDPEDLRERMEENEDLDSEQAEDTREELEDRDQET